MNERKINNDELATLFGLKKLISFPSHGFQSEYWTHMCMNPFNIFLYFISFVNSKKKINNIFCLTLLLNQQVVRNDNHLLVKRVQLQKQQVMKSKLNKSQMKIVNQHVWHSKNLFFIIKFLIWIRIFHLD